MAHDEQNEINRKVELILNGPAGKARYDLRDRACYMYITGTYPSHLRKLATRMLASISKTVGKATSLDGRSGNALLDAEIALRLDLENHPMVQKVREFLARGYRIKVSLGANERKPYGKIFLYRGDEEVTVKADGSVLDHW